MISVVLSIGHGRLHLVTSAQWLEKVGIRVSLICGWVPRNAKSFLVCVCSRIVGRDLSYGMAKRQIASDSIVVCSCAGAEFFNVALGLIERRFPKLCRPLAGIGWRFFGFVSRRYIRNAEIFHCRSGAGRGGAIAAAKRRGMKVVVDHSIAHPAFLEKQLRSEYEKNGVAFDLGLDSPFWRQVVRDCEDADIVQVNSYFVRDTFVNEGFDPEKIRVVYLGEREDFFGLRQPKSDNSAPLKLLFTGGFGFRKGGEYILEACKTLKERGVAYALDVVGDASGAAGMIARYEQYDLPITFHGPKPQDKLKSFLANGDIYVFPSLAEGCAQSGMEAMAAGMCVVGTCESGFPITDGEDGYIVPSKDAKAIADRIEWLAKNREEIDRTGKNAAKLIRENYTWEKYAENVKRIYEELVGDTLSNSNQLLIKQA